MSFFNFKNLAMTSSMTSSFPKSGGFVYSLLPMYILSFKFVQALLLFKIAGEGSQGKKNARKKKKKQNNNNSCSAVGRTPKKPNKINELFGLLPEHLKIDVNLNILDPNPVICP